MKFSRRLLADYVKTLHQKACRTIIFLHSTNQIIDLWCCRWSFRRQILNSLLFHKLTHESRNWSGPVFFFYLGPLTSTAPNPKIHGSVPISKHMIRIVFKDKNVSYWTQFFCCVNGVEKIPPHIPEEYQIFRSWRACYLSSTCNARERCVLQTMTFKVI